MTCVYRRSGRRLGKKFIFCVFFFSTIWSPSTRSDSNGKLLNILLPNDITNRQQKLGLFCIVLKGTVRLLWRLFSRPDTTRRLTGTVLQSSPPTPSMKANGCTRSVRQGLRCSHDIYYLWAVKDYAFWDTVLV